MKFEQDEVTIAGGVRHGITQAGPVADQSRQHRVAQVETIIATDPVDPVELKALARNAPLTRPRPATPTWPACRSTASTTPARSRAGLGAETAARVALGRVAANFLEQTDGVRVVSHVIELGAVRAPDGLWPQPDDVAQLDADPVRCLDPSRRGDGRADRPGAQGRRHPRRRRRGRRPRPAAGPRLARALGPPPRQPARGRADGHPGDQGRRGRRRLRARRHPGLAGARRDRATADGLRRVRRLARAAPRAG